MHRNLICRLTVSFIRRIRDKSINLKTCAHSVIVAVLIAASAIFCFSAASASSREDELESARRSGDLHFERRHAWGIVARLANSENAQSEAAFESWYGEAQVFADSGTDTLSNGMRGFWRSVATTRRRDPEASQSAGAPVLTYTFYNAAAFEHIRQKDLYKSAALDRLRTDGATDATTPSDRTVPAFPRESIVLKTVWWPVAPQGITALPVWDPETNPARREGNGYLTWERVVAVDPSSDWRTGAVSQLELAGRSFANSRRIGLDQFYHISVDAHMADNMMHDPETKKAALIALGRQIRAGDYLLLVAGNFTTKDIDDWEWAAFWWHDRPEQGAFAAGRPDTLKREWRNYLLQVAFDSEKPTAADGGPHICFNPWLEARFPDAGRGGGTVSNCMACHRRASYPEISALPVTRGAADSANDPAYAADRLRTDFVWSLAMHARPSRN